MSLLLTYKRIYTFLWCKDTPVLFMFFSYKEFEGNTDQFLVVRHLLKNPINVTRYIRIYPMAWISWISLRADFYGCKSGMLEYAIIFRHLLRYIGLRLGQLERMFNCHS